MKITAKNASTGQLNIRSSTRWASYKNSNNNYIAALKLAKTNFLQHTFPSMLTNDPQKFERVINPSRRNYIEIIDSIGSTVSEADCPSVLNDSFCANFVDSSDRLPLSALSYNYLPMDPIIMEPRGIAKKIESFKFSSNPGTDLIPSKFVRSTVLYSSDIFSKLSA